MQSDQGKQRDVNASEVQKQLQLNYLKMAEYLTNKYALRLDFRTTDENALHGTGRKIENASEGIILQIEEKSESLVGALSAYVYLITEAQLKIQNGAYVSTLY